MTPIQPAQRALAQHRATAWLAVAAFALAACSGARKPAPSGPPPDYETPRGYDGGVGETVAAPPPAAPAASPQP